MFDGCPRLGGAIKRNRLVRGKGNRAFALNSSRFNSKPSVVSRFEPASAKLNPTTLFHFANRPHELSPLPALRGGRLHTRDRRRKYARRIWVTYLRRTEDDFHGIGPRFPKDFQCVDKVTAREKRALGQSPSGVLLGCLLKSRGANSASERRQVCHSWSVPGDS
jgi:hypothetical protein